MATWQARLGRAVAMTVAIYLLFSVGWLFLLVATTRGPEHAPFAYLSPFVAIIDVTFDLARRGRRPPASGSASGCSWRSSDAWPSPASCSWHIRTFDGSSVRARSPSAARARPGGDALQGPARPPVE